MCVGNINKSNVAQDNHTIRSDVNISHYDKYQYTVNRDILSMFIYYTKLLISLLNNFNEKIQNLNVFGLLLRSTQPAHLLTLVSAVSLAKILSFQEDISEREHSSSNFVKFIYLTSIATHFGTQIWMTFVSGLALYLSLPRHTFGDVQKVLFPKYFMINAILSLITLITFLQCRQNVHQNVQIFTLVTCFWIEFLIRLYMTPKLLKLMTDKNLMETAAGIGMEVGQHTAGSLTTCPIYNQVYGSFRKVHMIIAIGNMITMACTAVHLYYLSHKLAI